MQLFGFIIHCKMHSDMHNSAWDATIDLPPTHQKKKVITKIITVTNIIVIILSIKIIVIIINKNTIKWKHKYI